ncbi:hypothetical protein [Catellatospora sichuanensis]|uniref:hypothetical protein n=1 Tax=Catellatospora sichuanensis TaxID=1969805 RepID=UPI001183FA5B|nr:hypothetical protein [Catellatospora sichuanensis]
MNPWQMIKREIDGARRSLRYDLARRRMKGDTAEMPAVGDGPDPQPPRARHRVVLATGALVLASVGVGGYYAIAAGVDALLGDERLPGALPHVTVPAGSAEPVPWRQTNATPSPTDRVKDAPAGQIVTPGPSPRRTPSPTPTPCDCESSPTPSPSHKPSPSPSPSPSPCPSPSVSASTSASASAPASASAIVMPDTSHPVDPVPPDTHKDPVTP